MYKEKKKINYPNKIYTQDKFFLICLKKKGVKKPRNLDSTIKNITSI